MCHSGDGKGGGGGITTTSCEPGFWNWLFLLMGYHSKLMYSTAFSSCIPQHFIHEYETIPYDITHVNVFYTDSTAI